MPGAFSRIFLCQFVRYTMSKRSRAYSCRAMSHRYVCSNVLLQDQGLQEVGLFPGTEHCEGVDLGVRQSAFPK